MKASLEKLERSQDKLIFILIFAVIAVRLIVFFFPQYKSTLPEGGQTVETFILLLLLYKTVKISDKLQKSTVDIGNKINESDIKINEIDNKIENKQSGCLLEDGDAWHKGADLIGELNEGDTILACNLVSWKPDQITKYEKANKKALKRKVNIKRLYADNPNNAGLAKRQSDWVKDTEFDKYFKRKMYEDGHQMLDYILAIDSGMKPKWAVLWIYMPEDKAEPNILFGFHIIDKKTLEGMMEDFNEKWNNKEFAKEADFI